MAQLPTKAQILALLRDEPMTGCRLRGALGLPKKLKLSFKQLLAEMVEDGTLNRTCHKEYRLSEKEPGAENLKVKDNRRPGARSRRQETLVEKTNRSMRGVLHQIDEERFFVTDLETGREYPMAHRKTPPGKDGESQRYDCRELQEQRKTADPQHHLLTGGVKTPEAHEIRSSARHHHLRFRKGQFKRKGIVRPLQITEHQNISYNFSL